MKYSVVIPVYNEERALTETLDRVKKVMMPYDSEIIAVNDGSKDKSGEILKKTKGINVIHHPYNLGYGASLKDGIKQAKGEYIIITDSDGTYPIEDIPKLIKLSRHFDMVVGARTGKHVHDVALRKPAKWILKKFAKFLTGRNVPDINSGLRIFKKDMAMEFFHVCPSGFSFTTTITLAALTNSYTVKYVPINYFKRKGKSSIRPSDFYNFMVLMIRVIIHFKPLKFFLFPGITLLLLSFLHLIYRLIRFADVSDLSIILFVGGLQIIFIGIIADLIVKHRKT